MVKPTSTPRPRPGDLLLHPLAVVAVFVLVTNDHLLKGLAPGLLTGKLSDFAGLVFFPLLCASVVEIAALGLRRGPPDRWRLVVGSIVATGLVFALVKTTSLGTAAFAWSMGAARWLAGAGPLQGDDPHPVAVMTDPGDLVALAAFVGAAWIARPGRASRLATHRWQSIGTPPRTPSAAVVVVLVAASFATIASGGAVQQFSSTTVEEHIHFDANHTAATRHVSFDVDNDDPNLRTIMLSAATSLDEPSQQPAPAIAVTLIPDQPAGTITSGFGGLALTDLCRSSCHHGATIVARLDGEPPVDGLDVTLEGRLWASGSADRPELDIKLALRNDADLAFTGQPTARVASSKGKFRVTSAAPTAKKRLQVRVAADALKTPLEYPLVVTVTMSGKARKIEFADVPRAVVTVGDIEIPLPMDGASVQSIDVGAACRAGHVCEIPILVRLDYTPTSTVMNPPSIPRAGSAEVTWRIEVRVDAFDGRRLPVDAVSIE